MSFFQWVREGVRQAVVLGFADAIEDVGNRSRDEDSGPPWPSRSGIASRSPASRR